VKGTLWLSVAIASIPLAGKRYQLQGLLYNVCVCMLEIGPCMWNDIYIKEEGRGINILGT
jgi:hypothetical protein